jgi:dUTP pyrophosphatase
MQLNYKMLTVKIKKIHSDAILPSYAHNGDAGLDLFSNEETEILPQERKLIGTGLSMEFSEGYVALIWDKSGVAYNNGIKVMGGVIEHTYRGEYKVLLYNTSKEKYKIKKGQKIAQLLIQPIVTAEIKEVKELSETKRGEGGFGSTGK